MRRAKIVKVHIEEATDTGLFHATSPDMRELFVSRHSIEDLKVAVPKVIEAIMAAHGQSVCAYEVEDDDSMPVPMPWVVVPNEARRAC